MLRLLLITVASCSIMATRSSSEPSMRSKCSGERRGGGGGGGGGEGEGGEEEEKGGGGDQCMVRACSTALNLVLLAHERFFFAL